MRLRLRGSHSDKEEAQLSEALRRLEAIAAELEQLNERLEAENRKIKAAILALADAMDELLESVEADPDVIARAREANRVARTSVLT